MRDKENIDGNSGDIYGDTNVDLGFEVVGEPCHDGQLESDPNGVSIPMQNGTTQICTTTSCEGSSYNHTTKFSGSVKDNNC